LGTPPIGFNFHGYLVGELLYKDAFGKAYKEALF